jgi:single-strand DNA-binding protein
VARTAASRVTPTHRPPDRSTTTNENTFHGTVGREIRLNHSQRTGDAVVNFSIAINSRRFDKSKGQWVERPTVWKDVVVFGLLAENVYDSLTTGMLVAVTGEEIDGSYTKESREPGGEDVVIRRTKIEPARSR